MKRFGLKQILIALLSAIALVTLVTGTMVLLTLGELRAAATARTTARMVTASIDEFIVALLDQETGIRGYLVTGAKINLEPYERGTRAQVSAQAQLERTLAAEPEELATLQAAVEAARTWQRSVAIPVVATLADPAGRGAAAQIETRGDGKRAFDRVRKQLHQLQELEDRRIARSDAAFQHADRLMGVVVVVGPAVVLLFCAGVAFALTRVVFQPLLQLVATMRRLAAKDLTVEVPRARSRNEVGEMARAVQAFKDGLIEVERTSVLRVLADTVPALIGYVDARRHVRFLNKGFGEWFKLPASDVTQIFDSPLKDVFGANTLPGDPDQLNSALGGYQSRVDHKFTQPDGTTRDIEAVYQPHRAKDGEILGAVTLITDVTQRKDYDRRLAIQARDLKRSNEELEQFAYVASHDLKAPLRGIENLITWIEEDISEHLQGDTRNNMNLLHNRVQRLESLLNDLLEYSRAGRREHATEAIDTGTLVKDLAVLISPPAGFTITMDDDLPILKAPRAPLTQVFQNLMSNAIKHHDDPANGHVHVSSRAQPEATEFIVTDNGPGIPVRFHERVFGMFQTLRPRDEVEGSGMGLAIVKKLIETHGGSVNLGLREGRGTAVHFVWQNERRGDRG